MAFPSFALSSVFTRSGLPQPEAETLTDQLEEAIDEKIEESHTGLATTTSTSWNWQSRRCM